MGDEEIRASLESQDGSTFSMISYRTMCKFFNGSYVINIKEYKIFSS